MTKKIYHYGTPRHSGRYPWGSGENPQRSKDFLGYVRDLKKGGMSDVDIAKSLNITTTQLRAKKSIAKSEQRKADFAQAIKLKNKGYSNTKIGRRMGMPESSVRSLLDPVLKERSEVTAATADMLKVAVAKKKYLDVGLGVENHIGISRTKLKTAIAMLEEQGTHRIHKFDIEQVGTGKRTNMMVLTEKHITYGDVIRNKDKIKMTTDHYTEDGGRTWAGIEPPKSVSSKRIKVRYAEEGGSDKDGVIELRRGVDDISLGESRYAQVRIAVDDTHYLKGMAMYTDSLPKGVDIVFNTNKSKNKISNDLDAMKKITDDPDNPFGSTIRQRHYIDGSGKKQLSPINIVSSGDKLNVEGRWAEWSKSLSSQVLSKQHPSLAKNQLALTAAAKQEEFDEIMSLTNPVIKRKLLNTFADSCDSAAAHLKAAAMPRQRTHVILPFIDMKEREIYAPNYNNGEKVVLIRYPHGGTFEIPEVTVNNKHVTAKRLLGDAIDAIGIHPKIAERLSGADFDGDTVLVIPNKKGLIKTSSPIKGLMDFNPKESYPPHDGMITVDGGVYNAKTKEVDYKGKRPRTQTKQLKMGDVSNLITDMTIKGANPNEIARAVRHSMVVIDSEKHHLDYKKSYNDNGIAGLKAKYQGGSRSGASTLISKAESPKYVDIRKERIDPKTGKKVYEYTPQSFVNKEGKTITRRLTSTKMAETDDAFTLSSGTTIETVYATHANKLKAMANKARKEALTTPTIKQSASAKQTYAQEAASLKAHLNLALMNAPLERQAQLLAGKVVASKKANNPNLDRDDLKTIKGQALVEARLRVGAKKQRIDITPREWEAIQAGAISNNVLTQIINNTDLDKVKQLATPRTTLTITPAKISKAKLMLNSGYTQSEVAEALGVSVSTLIKSLK